MKQHNWLTEIISATTKIFITSLRYSLAKQLKNHLEKISAIQLVDADAEYQIVIHLAGYDEPSLEESLQYTSVLHQYLDAALKRHAKFILVLPTTTSAFGQVARSVVEQFGRNFALSYMIVETGVVSDPQATAVEVIKAFVGDYQPASMEVIAQPETVKKPKPKNQSGWKTLFIGFLIIISPWMLLVLLVLGVGGGLRCAMWGLDHNKWEITTRCAAVADSLSRVATPLTVLTPGVPLAEPLATASHINSMLKQVNDVGDLLLPYVTALVNPKSAAPEVDTAKVVAYLGSLNESLSLLQSQLQQTSGSVLPLDLFAPRVSTARKLVSQLSVLMPYVPQLESLSGQSRWLVLLQDNTELRPTGGFIAGIALVALEGGHITQTQFLSTDVVDAQLRGEVDPPAEVKQVLGEKRWYLRDANWDPDFPSTAARAAWFVNKELDQQVDGVIAINLETLRQLTEILGPVDLAQFGGKINSTNLLQNYLKNVKFDSADAQMLPQLSEKLFHSSQGVSAQKLRQLGLILLSGLEKRQIFVWTPSAATAGLAQLNWDGRLDSPDCGSAYPCVNQTVYLVDTNIGLNKVDAWISRTAEVLVKITAEAVTTSYAWQYHHSGSSTGWPGGTYKDYVRIYMPVNSQITQVALGGKVIAANQYQLQSEHGFIRLALPVQLNPGEKTQLKLELAQPVPEGTRWHLLLGLPNQPGVPGYPVSVTIRYPANWWVTTSVAPQIASGGVLGYNSQVNRYLRWDMDWVPSP